MKVELSINRLKNVESLKFKMSSFNSSDLICPYTNNMTTKREEGHISVTGRIIHKTVIQCPQWRNALHNNTKAVKTLETGKTYHRCFISQAPCNDGKVTQLALANQEAEGTHISQSGEWTPPYISRLLLLYGTTLFRTLRMSLCGAVEAVSCAKFVKWSINKTIFYTPSSFYTNQVDKKKKPTTKRWP